MFSSSTSKPQTPQVVPTPAPKGLRPREESLRDWYVRQVDQNRESLCSVELDESPTSSDFSFRLVNRNPGDASLLDDFIESMYELQAFQSRLPASGPSGLDSSARAMYDTALEQTLGKVAKKHPEISGLHDYIRHWVNQGQITDISRAVMAGVTINCKKYNLFSFSAYYLTASPDAVQKAIA